MLLLVVDDDPLIRRALVSVFRERVVAAETSAAAVLLASKMQPRVILLDVLLGYENGIDAIAPLLAASPSSRIVMLTGATNGSDRREALTAGASGYISKSNLDRIEEIVDEFATLDADSSPIVLH